MDCKSRNIDVLIRECVEHLQALGYSKASISEHWIKRSMLTIRIRSKETIF